MNGLYMHGVAYAASSSSDEEEDYYEEHGVHHSGDFALKLRDLTNRVSELEHKNNAYYNENKKLNDMLKKMSNDMKGLQNENSSLRKTNTRVYDDKHCTRPKFGPVELPSHSPSEKVSLSKEVNILTDVDILYVGLKYAGFDPSKRQKGNLGRNIERFKSFYGVPPTTVKPFFTDLKQDNPNIIFKDCFMTMNWLYSYDTYSVLAGRWGYCEEYIGPKVVDYGKKMAKLKEKKILFEFKHNSKYKASVDGVNFNVNEFRLDPSKKWYNHKSNCCGLVSYTLFRTAFYFGVKLKLNTCIFCTEI